MNCTFFGHRDTDTKIEPMLKSTLIELIENKSVDTFYVGKNGNFDDMVIKNLEILKSQYPHINYFIVNAYLKNSKNDTNVIYPIFLRTVLSPIPKRNEWMIDICDYIITYVNRFNGGAARAKRYAKRNKKIIIEL